MAQRAGAPLLDLHPTLTTASEKQVWDRLLDPLGPDDVLGANLRLSHQGHDREVDLSGASRVAVSSRSRSRAGRSGRRTAAGG